MALKRSSKFEGEVPTASLPDIIFTLIIFFLVTTTITSDKGVSLTLPEFSESTETVKLKKDMVLNVLVSEGGEIMVDAEVLANRGELLNRIRTSLEEKGKDAEGKYHKIVSIKTQGGTLYDDYMYVLDQVKAAGASKISIAEPEE
ncbi:MAG: biopolymer transporter ExbD [bacterium]|jgi:biopolymer transport protein ExbD|nr:biopolymer transporter ExbD [bacterium]